MNENGDGGFLLGLILVGIFFPPIWALIAFVIAIYILMGILGILAFVVTALVEAFTPKEPHVDPLAFVPDTVPEEFPDFKPLGT